MDWIVFDRPLSAVLVFFQYPNERVHLSKSREFYMMREEKAQEDVQNKFGSEGKLSYRSKGSTNKALCSSISP